MTARTLPVPAPALSRRFMLMLPLAAAGCVSDVVQVQTVFQPLDFSYLAKLRLNVGRIDIASVATMPFGGRDVGYMSPEQPVASLVRMAQQRLVAAGSTGRAVFTIDQATLLPGPGQYSGNFAVHLDILDDSGARIGFAEARVARSSTSRDDSPATMRAALYQLTRLMMADMNVEFEYQIRRTLRDFLQAAATTAPLPGQVESQPLGSPAPAPPPPPLTTLRP